MNNFLYDNSTKMLGTKTEIVNYILDNIKEARADQNEAAIEESYNLLEEIAYYSKDTIFMIDYDNPMGYTIETWNNKDKVQNN